MTFRIQWKSAGPTMEMVLNRTSVDPSEPLGTFLHPLQVHPLHEELKELSRYARYPLQRLQDQLQASGEEEADEQLSSQSNNALFDNVMRGHVFN